MAKVIVSQGTGSNKNTAKENVNFPYEVKFDATQAWKKAKDTPGFSLKEFAKDYAEKKIKGASGVGFVITVDAAVEDVRSRPYKEKNEATTGRRKWKTNYSIYTPDNVLLGEADKKDEALKLAKKLIVDAKVDLTLRVTKKVVEGQNIAAELIYSPTKGSKDGSYIFFAVETESN